LQNVEAHLPLSTSTPLSSLSTLSCSFSSPNFSIIKQFLPSTPHLQGLDHLPLVSFLPKLKGLEFLVWVRHLHPFYSSSSPTCNHKVESFGLLLTWVCQFLRESSAKKWRLGTKVEELEEKGNFRT
jgi:hypothetical protein